MALKKNRVFRTAGIVIASGLLLSGSMLTAHAQPQPPAPGNVADTAEAIANAVPGVGDVSSATATEKWNHSSVTRTISVNGKQGLGMGNSDSVSVKPGDVLKYTVTYQADSFFTQEGIVSLTDVKPAGLKYVTGSASYTIGSTKTNANEANKWLKLEDGAVKFTGSWDKPYRATRVEFTWEYQVESSFVVGKHNTGMVIDWVVSADSDLKEMGPYLERKDEPKLPGLGSIGSGGFSPSLGSPSLPKLEMPAWLSSPSLPSPSAK